MSCERAVLKLKAYSDGELGWIERIRVERHLNGCDQCRAELAAIKKLSNVLRALPVGSPSDDFSAKVMNTVWKSDLQEAYSRRWSRRPAMVGALIAVICLASFAAYLAMPDQPADVGEIARLQTPESTRIDVAKATTEDAQKILSPKVPDFPKDPFVSFEPGSAPPKAIEQPKEKTKPEASIPEPAKNEPAQSDDEIVITLQASDLLAVQDSVVRASADAGAYLTSADYASTVDKRPMVTLSVRAPEEKVESLKSNILTLGREVKRLDSDAEKVALGMELKAQPAPPTVEGNRENSNVMRSLNKEELYNRLEKDRKFRELRIIIIQP